MEYVRHRSTRNTIPTFLIRDRSTSETIYDECVFDHDVIKKKKEKRKRSFLDTLIILDDAPNYYNGRLFIRVTFVAT